MKLPNETEMVLLRFLRTHAEGSRFTLLKQRVAAAALDCHPHYAGDCLRRLARHGYLEINRTVPRSWRLSVAGAQLLGALDALPNGKVQK